MATPKEKEENILNELLDMSEEELEERARVCENDEIEFGEEDEVREGSPLGGERPSPRREGSKPLRRG